MAPHPVPSSGVLGAAGRVAVAGPVRSAGLRLAGAPLPVLGTARVYTCGITPYDVTHLGHAATFVWADALRGVLEMAGVEVISSRNVTDVDDVLTRAADAKGRHYDEFALSQEFLFERDMDGAGGAPPHARAAGPLLRHPRAAADRRAAGRRPGVRARGARLLPRRRRAGAGRAWTAPRRWRCPRRSGTRRATRCARTRSTSRCGAPPGRPTPPGRARGAGAGRAGTPSARRWRRPPSGPRVDVLVGGEDLTFPHHAYQAAMVEAALSVTPFARRMLHVGAVSKDGAKMAKSTGNLTLVADLLETAPAAAVRLMLLDRRWSEGWEFRPELLVAATDALHELYAAAARPGATDAAQEEVVRGAARRPRRPAGPGRGHRGRGRGGQAAHPRAVPRLTPTEPPAVGEAGRCPPGDLSDSSRAPAPRRVAGGSVSNGDECPRS